jgi:hypothetical protein
MGATLTGGLYFYFKAVHSVHFVDQCIQLI